MKQQLSQQEENLQQMQNQQEQEQVKYQEQLEEERQRRMLEQERQKLELEEVKEEMKKEQERQKKAFEDQKSKYEIQIKDNNQMKQIQEKMKDIRRDIAEANEIAKFMNKNIVFQDVYISKFDDQGIYSGGGNINELQDEVQVKVQNFEAGQLSMWTAEKFQNKLMEMRDALQAFEDQDFKELQREDDPFYEEPQPILLGQAYYLLEGLPYLLDSPRVVPIVAPNSDVHGQIYINVVPCDEFGNEELDEEALPEDPMDLLNQRLDFKVQIDKLTNLPKDFCSKIYCEYSFFMDDEVYSTPVAEERNTDPILNYSRQHTHEVVTKFLIDYLLEDKLSIKIFGT